MPKKLKSPSYATPRDRFCFYLEKLFGNNQRRMSEETGLSQAVISKIALGKQDPGSRVLKSLSQHPKVNPAWLLSGEGDPLLAERKSHGDQGWPLPIAEVLLPGPPASCRDMMTSQIELVAGAVYRESSYVYVLTDDIHNEQMRPGDRILLDANPRRWRRNLRVLDGKLCAVQQQTPKGPHIELRRVTCSFTGDGKDVELSISTLQKPEIDPEIGKEFRSDPLGNPEEVGRSSSTRVVITIENIVAIAIQLFRDL